LPEQIRQAVALDVLHHQIEQLAVADVERRDDIRMTNAGCEPGFVQKHGRELFVVTQMRVTTLNRDQTLEACGAALASDIHRRHAATGELGQQGVVAERGRRGPCAQWDGDRLTLERHEFNIHFARRSPRVQVKGRKRPYTLEGCLTRAHTRPRSAFGAARRSPGALSPVNSRSRELRPRVHEAGLVRSR
jgi:hypothetical protein